MRRVAFATCKVLPEPDVDEELLLSACREAGIEAEMAGWDDPSVHWSSYSMVVVRSTWNYHLSPSKFCDWIEHVNSVSLLLNPARMMLGNIHKGYLLELERQGIPIVPTRIISKGERVKGKGKSMPWLRSLLEETGWKKFVIKPAVSAASYMTYSFSCDEIDLAQTFLDEMVAGRDAMVQEFVSGGEVALVHINGVLTHAVEKYARFADGVESVSSVASVPSGAQQDLAARAMSCVEPGWLYARVDVMQDAAGRWLLSELELIEPSLFLLQKPEALRSFLESIATRLVSGK